MLFYKFNISFSLERTQKLQTLDSLLFLHFLPQTAPPQRDVRITILFKLHKDFTTVWVTVGRQKRYYQGIMGGGNERKN